VRAYFDSIKIKKAMEFAKTAPFPGADDSYSPYSIVRAGVFLCPEGTEDA